MLKQVLLTAAASIAFATAAFAADMSAKVPDYVTAAIADAGRPDTDKARDANRKPAETVLFAGVKPGSTVVELVPAKGYFTRIFSRAVGAKGKVYAVSPPRRATAAIC